MPSAAEVLAQMEAGGDHGEADPDQLMEEDDDYDDEPNLTDDDVLGVLALGGLAAMALAHQNQVPYVTHPQIEVKIEMVDTLPRLRRDRRFRPRIRMGTLDIVPVGACHRPLSLTVTGRRILKHRVQKVDSYIQVAKKIIDESEIGL